MHSSAFGATATQQEEGGVEGGVRSFDNRPPVAMEKCADYACSGKQRAPRRRLPSAEGNSTLLSAAPDSVLNIYTTNRDRLHRAGTQTDEHVAHLGATTAETRTGRPPRRRYQVERLRDANSGAMKQTKSEALKLDRRRTQSIGNVPCEAASVEHPSTAFMQDETNPQATCANLVARHLFARSVPSWLPPTVRYFAQ